MSVVGSPLEIASQLLYREAHYLDERQWNDWLALYDREAEFWAPAWKGNNDPTSDPDSEISLIYLSSRQLLEERVSRVVSGRSAASVPLPRTAHCVTNIIATQAEAAGMIEVRALLTTHVIDLKLDRVFVNVSRCEYSLIANDRAWLIRRKKALLLNQSFPPIFDFYLI